MNTQHKFLWRTAHFDHGPPSGVSFNWHVTQVHVARSSERLCNYIKEGNSCSIKCTWHFSVSTQIINAFARYGNNGSCTFYM